MMTTRAFACLLLLGLPLMACGDEGGTPTPPPGEDVAVTPDAGEVGGDTRTEDTAAMDTGGSDGPTTDVEVGDPACLAAAEALACEWAVTSAWQQACAAVEDDAVASCERDCLTEATDCDAAAACLGVSDFEAQPVNQGPYGIFPREVAGPATIPTLRGDVALEDLYGGENVVMFSTYVTPFQNSNGETVDYFDLVWKSSTYSWLYHSPDNVHWFMTAYPEPGTNVDQAQQHVMTLKASVDEALEKIALVQGKARACHWMRRVHYVPVAVTQLGNWVSQKLASEGGLGFGIDREQKLRNLGMLGVIGQNPLLAHLNYEAEYYNFEWQREQDLYKGDMTEVMLYENVSTGGGTIDVTFPSAEEMAGFDTLELDLTSHCPGHTEGANCPEWDYLAHLWVKEQPAAPNGDVETPCQGAVAAVAAADEVMGVCAGDGASCAVDIDCTDGTACEGYVAAIESVEGVDADTLSCTCLVPAGDPRESTQTCLQDGSGYGDCSCDGQRELARWITTYAREGRWVSDASPLLPLLSAGGNIRFRYKAGNTYLTRFSIRLYNQGKSERPVSLTPLFTGGGYNASYNDKYEPLTVAIPEGTAKAEIFALITGHGFGVEVENCAEFCDHTHHFAVNDNEYMHDQPFVGNTYGCAMQIDQGTVPNQYGTWYFGRGGWCPGMDVKPYVEDVTADVAPGEDATITYRSLFEGEPYVPQPSSGGNGGFGGNINMQSWLVTYEAVD
jgi:hypothetical protein